MKKLLFPCMGLLLCHWLFAQQEPALNGVATQLFKDVKTKLTAAEKNQIAGKLGFILSGNATQPFALDKDSKEYPFSATVLPTDMNKDGKEEIFVAYGNSFTSGHTGSSIALYIKDANGKYTDQLGFPGMVPDALTTLSKGYPDLVIGGPGFEFPVWRWNGKAYSLLKNVSDKNYSTLKKEGVDNVSKTYQQTLQ